VGQGYCPGIEAGIIALDPALYAAPFEFRFDHDRLGAGGAQALAGAGPIQVAPARTSARRILWRGKWLAVGDAAWCMDPLSGGGIEQAVSDGIGAGRAVARALESGDDGTLRTHALSRARSFRLQLHLQRGYYAAERRWRDETFWLRRTLPGSAEPGAAAAAARKAGATDTGRRSS